MTFRWFKKSDLIAGVIVFGFMAVLFLALAALGDSLAVERTLNGVVIQKSDPDYVHKIWLWRIGMSVWVVVLRRVELDFVSRFTPS